jgi:hypothetical protein
VAFYTLGMEGGRLEKSHMSGGLKKFPESFSPKSNVNWPFGFVVLVFESLFGLLLFRFVLEFRLEGGACVGVVKEGSERG